MKPALQPSCRILFSLLSAIIFLSPCAGAEPLTLKHAVELALTHSPAAGQTSADQQRAYESFREARNQYMPQLTVGSGLGDSWGYPLSLEGSAPSLVNVTAQSALFNPALRDYIRAARSEYKASEAGSKDQRNQIMQDTVLAYTELLKWQQLIGHLQQQHDDALHTQQIIDQRVQEGVDNPQLRNQARLAAARANLHMVEAESSVHELRALLSQLTGLPEASIEPAADSVPALPEIPSQAESADIAADASPGVLFAREHAEAQSFRARAEHRLLWPTADFATQYAVLAKYNNWQKFFISNAFERNNATVGVVLRFPIFNAAQRAHAAAADADAVHAKKEVESIKNQASQQVLKMQDSVRQLAAAKEVSDLEFEIAKSNMDAIEVRLNAGSATVPDAANARTEMFEKYNAAQNADFALLRARIGLLRLTGDLESWVKNGL
ncbi:MAG TPA: TolC family protein [Terriglobales bacterium]|nr:TolC family protein [Terriglobales bacterium]